MTQVSIIAAVSDNNVIGSANTLPWRIPQDLAHFKAVTMGSTLIMGRKTFDSIGRALPGRTTIVLTRRGDFAAPGVLVARDASQALAMVPGPRAFVAGGAEIYRLFLPLASKLYLTRVHGNYDGDTSFPAIDWTEWRRVSSESGTPDPAQPAVTFEIFDREPPL